MRLLDMLTGWKNLFLCKIKGMNDRGIIQTFHICAWFCLKLKFKFIVWMGYIVLIMGYMYRTQHEVFWLLTWKRLHSEVTPERDIILIRKKGPFHFEASVPFKCELWSFSSSRFGSTFFPAGVKFGGGAGLLKHPADPTTLIDFKNPLGKQFFRYHFF